MKAFSIGSAKYRRQHQKSNMENEKPRAGLRRWWNALSTAADGGGAEWAGGK